MNNCKILNYGSLNIDLIFKVDHMVREGETLSSSSFQRSAGGKGANQSAAMAKAGLKVYHAGKLGKDGLFLIDLLKGYGVDCSLIKVCSCETGKAVIQLDKRSQNSIILLPGGNREIAEEEIDETLKHFSAGDWLILQNEISNIPYLIDCANAKGMKICMNPSPFDETISNIDLSRVSLLFINEIEGEALSGGLSDPESIVAHLTAKYPDMEIVLTLGKRGALYAHGSERAQFGVFDVPVVDTTAAGDTFTGFFLAARINGENPASALEFASRASSITVSRIGAMCSIPTLEEVNGMSFDTP